MSRGPGNRPLGGGGWSTRSKKILDGRRTNGGLRVRPDVRRSNTPVTRQWFYARDLDELSALNPGWPDRQSVAALVAEWVARRHSERLPEPERTRGEPVRQCRILEADRAVLLAAFPHSIKLALRAILLKTHPPEN